MTTMLTIRDRLFRWLLPTLAKNWERRIAELEERRQLVTLERDFLKDRLTDLQKELASSQQALLEDRTKIIDSLCWMQNQPGIYSGKLSPMFEKQQEMAAKMAEMGPGISRGRGGRKARAQDKARDFFGNYDVGPEKPLATQVHVESGERGPNPDPNIEVMRGVDQAEGGAA